MITDTYDRTLKQLIDFTQIKFNVLAKAIGYDISYISKWYNGVKLPASKKIDVINQEIASTLANNIIEQKKESEFQAEFAISNIKNPEDLSFQIYMLLSNAYRYSLKKETTEVKVDAEDVRLIYGNPICLDFIKGLLEDELGNATATPTLLITGEFCTLADVHFWQIFENVKLNKGQCNISVTLNLQKLQTHTVQYIDALYRCLNSLPNFNFTLYEKNTDAYDNVILLKNKFAITYIRNTEGDFDLCTYITNPNLVQRIYEKCKYIFSNQSMALMPKQTLGMQEFGYRDIFFTSNKFFFYLPNGVEFMLPDAVYDSIMENVNHGEYFPATTYWVERLKFILKTLQEKSALQFLIPTNSIIRYLETGHICISEMYYQLSPEERQKHIKEILTAMTANPNISIGVLHSSSGKSSYDNFTNLAFYSNYTSGFFKKNMEYKSKETPLLYLVNHPILLECIHQYFQNKMDSDNYNEYSVNELSMLCKKYKFLIDQAIHLGSNKGDV